MNLHLTKVRNQQHRSSSLNSSDHSLLLVIWQTALKSTLDVASSCQKLTDQFHIPPMDIIVSQHSCFSLNLLILFQWGVNIFYILSLLELFFQQTGFKTNIRIITAWIKLSWLQFSLLSKVNKKDTQHLTFSQQLYDSYLVA